jgi:SAM-dependent methyltransferase
VSDQAAPRPHLRARQVSVLSANAGRNLLASSARSQRWTTARDELWRLLDPLIGPSARVAVVGAGNGHDLPLRRIAARAAQVVLIDIDRRAPRRARRQLPPTLRRKVRIVKHDITGGTADAIIRAAARGQVPDPVLVPEAPLSGAPYDLVIGDLLYSQLLYPAMVDLGVPDPRRRSVLVRYGPALVRGVVARLHASAAYGRVVHLHDPLGWWPGHAQPVSLPEILDAAHSDVRRAIGLIGRGWGPRDADPRTALRHFAIPIRVTAVWRWPFAEDTDYLVCATVAGAPLQLVPGSVGCRSSDD